MKNVALAKLVEKRVLLTLGFTVVVALGFLLWPRPYQPPLNGLGKPIFSKPMGASTRYTYTFPGEYWSYAPTAESILKQRGFKRTNDDLTWYHHPDGSSVIIYPGKWKPWRTDDGMVDTFVKGWVTISCDEPPNRWKQMWIKFQLEQKRKAKAATVASTP